MKLLLMLSILVMTPIVIAQEFEVVIKIEGVTDLASAKEITDPIRYKYNQFPIFNDSTDQFEFNSKFNFTEEEIAVIISANGYKLIHFKSVASKEENEVEISYE